MMEDMKKNFLAAMMNKRMLVVTLMGFSSGLPLLLIGGTLKAWATEAGVDLGTIGLFSLVFMPYTLKFLWSPFLDHFVPPFMGRRKGWILIAQLGLIASFLAIATSNPANNTFLVAIIALIIAFFSATQDIAIDAYRREILNRDELGLGNSYAITAYRIAMLVAGGLALVLADFLPWPIVYVIMAAAMLVGVFATYFADEPHVEERPPQTLREAFTKPLADFFSRQGAIGILAFILLYKIGDTIASEMTMPFYIQLGFTKTEIAGVVKVFGIWSTIAGGLVGGALMLRIGLQRSLWVFGILQALSTAAFAWLAQMGAHLGALTVIISFENLTAGMGTAAYAAFMATLTNKRFTATQYALLTSFMGFSRFAAAPTGFIAEKFGWQTFFTFCAVAAIPGLFMLVKVGKWAHLSEPESETPPTTKFSEN